ncbi:FxsB family cyclophane-forming radical SAM/SPASM peptide maturase [Actinomadura decatromicini]|uniref:FxsB family radical SAM/SPASM domain protein n=1 Tax=Actinomadura decatromicini TaxID=2604572 RepID=A0A5D3FN12_9ACTN|nr:FxsB family cyclophane-forming radical SAM/SPASM peptide maturase [Actinomadura decatromicini]TYK49060.1 FxsB family radical SAM/SPASM domain protein [Actinomadura decatromicini]
MSPPARPGPLPFREFILKIHSRCDLACDYCYVYEMGDLSWRDRPVAMPPEVADAAARRIGDHARAHRITEVDVVLHGGEPLLAAPSLIERVVRGVRAEGVSASFSVQTNGTRLDAARLALLDRLGVRIGVSVDGDAAAQDRHRRLPNGRGSHAAVSAGLRALADGPYRHLFSGVLCTVDTRNDPVATYEALLRYRPPRVDFLLPHGTWSAPPPGRAEGSPATPYADWLIAIFDRWYGAAEPPTDVRTFSDLLTLLLGGRVGSEGLGLGPVRYAVIETDGAIEQSDLIRPLTAASAGVSAGTGLNVLRDPLDAALALPGVIERQRGAAALCGRCRACRFVAVCGAGLQAHRYRAGTGFDNPTVYCPDMIRLIEHVRGRVVDDLAVVSRRPGPDRA